MHWRFLEKQGPLLTGNTEDPRLQLPRRVLEASGIECAVWPHLYPRTDMCETYIRSSDVRRQARHARAKKGKAEGDNISSSSSSSSSSSDSSNSSSSDSDSSSTSEPTAQTSVKATPSAKKRSAAKLAQGVARKPASSRQPDKKADFSKEGGADFELLQFVYDLWLWSSLGAKKHAVKAPMRMALAGQSFSPEYWKVHHAGLVNMVKQLGHPTLFVTISPYEWTFPYHEFVKDEMQKNLRSTLHLPIAETLHIAHVLMETVEGLLAGGLIQGRQRRPDDLVVLCAPGVPGWQAQKVCRKPGGQVALLPRPGHASRAPSRLAARHREDTSPCHSVCCLARAQSCDASPCRRLSKVLLGQWVAKTRYRVVL